MSYLWKFHNDTAPTYDKSGTRKDAARKLVKVIELHEAFAAQAEESLFLYPEDSARVKEN